MFGKKVRQMLDIPEPELSEAEKDRIYEKERGQEATTYREKHTHEFGDLKIYAVEYDTQPVLDITTNIPMNADVVSALLQVDGVNRVTPGGRYRMNVEMELFFLDRKEVTDDILDTIKTIVTKET